MGILEQYIEGQPSEADLSVIDLLVTILIENKAENKALQHIDNARLVYCSGKELPINLKVREGICVLRLGHTKDSEVSYIPIFNISNCMHEILVFQTEGSGGFSVK